MTYSQFEAALDLTRRLPPNNVVENLGAIIELVPNLTEKLLISIDQPLQTAIDPQNGKAFLICDYNRDGDSFRSPWTNTYMPPLEDGAVPSDRLRAVEVAANELFDAYRDMYYEGGASSVYMWDLDHGFAACVLFKKEVRKGSSVGAEEGGVWDAIHVVQVSGGNGGIAGGPDKAFHYKLTTTIMLSLSTAPSAENQQVSMTLAGSVTRQVEHDLVAADSHAHIANIGQMIEEMESKQLNALSAIYFGKTREVVSVVRSERGLHSDNQDLKRALAHDLTARAHLLRSRLHPSQQ